MRMGSSVNFFLSKTLLGFWHPLEGNILLEEVVKRLRMIGVSLDELSIEVPKA
jgi:hypothetical protein